MFAICKHDCRKQTGKGTGESFAITWSFLLNNSKSKNRKNWCAIVQKNLFGHIAEKGINVVVRTVIDMISKVEALDQDKALKLQADLCYDSIDWCKKEKHTFLRQRVESRLASMFVNT